MENVDKELECILESGHYTFKRDISDTRIAYIMLEYIPATYKPGESILEENGFVNTSEVPLLQHQDSQTESEKKMSSFEKWSEEMINDFVRKLGFLDTESGRGRKIKRFLHINEVSNCKIKMPSYIGGKHFLLRGLQVIRVLLGNL